MAAIRALPHVEAGEVEASDFIITFRPEEAEDDGGFHTVAAALLCDSKTFTVLGLVPVM